MNPGAGEELGKTTRGLIDALKESPSLLVLVLFAIGVLFLVYLGVSNEREGRVEMTKLMLQSQGQTQELLSRCFTPGGNK